MVIEIILFVSIACNIGLTIWLVACSHSAGFHAGKASVSNDGWEDEAKFWRNVNHPKAEKLRIYNYPQ